MTKHDVWTAAFLGSTAVAVTMELIGAHTKNEDLVPWCWYLRKHVPRVPALVAGSLLSVWLVPHLVRVYQEDEGRQVRCTKKKGK